MTTDSQQQNPTIQAEPIDYKAIYEEGLGNESLSAIAKACSSQVFERLASIKPHTSSTVITGKMQAAIEKNDVSEILKLAEQLKALKTEEDSHIEQLTEMSKQFRFDELLAAYPEELEQLAYELAVLAMTSTEAAIQLSKKRNRSEAGGSGRKRNRSKSKKTFIVSHDGKFVEVVPNAGRPANPGNEREFFEFLGFVISEDGRTMTPSVFTDKAGQEANALSKKAIIEDMLAGNPLWADKGYTITEKPIVSPENAAEAA